MINSQHYCVYENIFIDDNVNQYGFIQKDINTYDIKIKQIKIMFDYEPKCFKQSAQNFYLYFELRNLYQTFILSYNN